MVGYYMAGLLTGFAVLGVVVALLLAAIAGVVWMVRRMPW